MALIRDIRTKPWSKSSVSCGDARAAVEGMKLHRRECMNHERHENTRKGETDKHKQILIDRVPIDKLNSLVLIPGTALFFVGFRVFRG